MGNLISAIVLGSYEIYYYSIVMSIICLLAIIFLFFLKPPKIQHLTIAERIQGKRSVIEPRLVPSINDELDDQLL